ncbi:hypothetical protein ABFX02_03G036200 [Erythranthe guttata]
MFIGTNLFCFRWFVSVKQFHFDEDEKVRAAPRVKHFPSCTSKSCRSSLIDTTDGLAYGLSKLVHLLHVNDLTIHLKVGCMVYFLSLIDVALFCL